MIRDTFTLLKTKTSGKSLPATTHWKILQHLSQLILILLATEGKNPAATLIIYSNYRVFITFGAAQSFQHRFYQKISYLSLPKDRSGMFQNKFIHDLTTADRGVTNITTF
ncbi:hypothetical protein [Cesiribacter sp. SM1]|uniref:hypothetical protein n=1 Tax=Cesiribacter sp. SM1 TaxID=2861196 RepID=UPI001CD630DA|nr:hypothetical protein [Cesiribacter sp. SM1]